MPVGDVPISSNYAFKPATEGGRDRSQFAKGPAASAGTGQKMAAFIALDKQGVSELTAGELQQIARFSASSIGIEAMVAKHIPRDKAEALCANGMEPAKLPFHLKLSSTELKAFDGLCAAAGANELTVEDFTDAGLRIDVADKLFGAVQDKLNTADAHIGTENLTTAFTAVQFTFERTDQFDKEKVGDSYRDSHSGTTSKTQNTFVPDVGRFETTFRNHFEQVVSDNKTLGLPNAGAVVDLSKVLNERLAKLPAATRVQEIRSLATDVAARMTKTETYQDKKAVFDQFFPVNKIRAEIGPSGKEFDPFSYDLSSKQVKAHSADILAAFKKNFHTGLAQNGDHTTNTGAAFEAILNHPGLTTEDKVAALAHIIEPSMSSGGGQGSLYDKPDNPYMKAINSRLQGVVGNVAFADLVVKKDPTNFRANTAGLTDLVQKFEAQQLAKLNADTDVIFNTLGGNK